MCKRLFSIILMVCSVSVMAQNIPVALSSSRIYDFIDELATDGVIQVNDAVRPFTERQIVLLLDSASRHADLLDARQIRDLEFFMNEYALARDTMPNNYVQYTDHSTFNLSLCDPQFAYRTANNMFKMQFRPILGMDIIASKKGAIFKRWYGAELKMDIAQHVSIWGSLRDVSWNGEWALKKDYFPAGVMDGARLTKGQYLNNLPGVQYKEANYGGDFSDSKGGLSLYAWWGSVSVARENIRWGDAYHSSNILSGRAPAVPQVSIQLTPCKWFQFDYFHAWLISNVIDSTTYYLEDNTTGGETRKYRPASKYMAANMFTFMPIKYIHFSLGNSIVYAERNPQAAYFIPIAFYKSLDHLLTKGLNTENQNSQAFFSLTVRPVDHLKLYGTFYVDEFKFGRLKKSNPERNPLSYVVGFDWTGWPVKGLSLKGEFMRSYIACYTHSIDVLTYKSNSYLLGHYMGDNAQNIFIEAAYRPYRGMFIGLSYSRDTKYNAYPYLRGGKGGGGIGEVIAQQPFAQPIFTNDQVALDFVYEVHPCMYMRVNMCYNNARGYDRLESDCKSERLGTAQQMLDAYCPVFYQGKNFTTTLGFSFGF